MQNSFDRIWNKIHRDGINLAVLVVGGKLKTCKVSDIPKGGEKRLLGVYDFNCKKEWLMEDLIWAEKHFPYEH